MTEIDRLPTFEPGTTNDVTPVDSELCKVNGTDPSVATKRDRTRERVRRHRAAKKQAAAIEFVRTNASLFLLPTERSSTC
jgi:hypothetical protein